MKKVHFPRTTGYKITTNGLHRKTHTHTHTLQKAPWKPRWCEDLRRHTPHVTIHLPPAVTVFLEYVDTQNEFYRSLKCWFNANSLHFYRVYKELKRLYRLRQAKKAWLTPLFTVEMLYNCMCEEMWLTGIILLIYLVGARSVVWYYSTSENHLHI